MFCKALPLLLLLTFSFSPRAVFAQDDRVGQRPELQLTLQQRYPVTVIGEGILGLRGKPDSIRQAGGVVVLQREGLAGSVERKGAAVLNIGLGPQPQLSGKNDHTFRKGERFYVHSIYVGTDVITLGLMTSQLVTTPTGTNRLWAAINFFFLADVLHRGDRNLVLSTIEQWLAPEAMQPIAAQPYAQPPYAQTNVAPAEPAASPVPASAAVQLTPGMSVASVEKEMGPPRRRVTFGEKTWLYYPGLILVFRADKLENVDSTSAPATVVVESEPGAEILVDGQLVGQAPATLELPAGHKKISIRKAGFVEWMREVDLLPGSRVSLTAQLAKN